MAKASPQGSSKRMERFVEGLLQIEYGKFHAYSIV
jgi:hypothetical protein